LDNPTAFKLLVYLVELSMVIMPDLRINRHTMEDPKAPLIPLEPSTEPKPELTFGIEIEFVVATAPVNEIDPQSELWGQIFEMHDRRHYTNERLVGAHICKTLNKYGIPAELHNGIFGWKPSNS